MKKIRIGMFSWESLYSIRVGGISPHVSELSDALAAEGHEVHLFTRDLEDKDEIING
ncbi:glycogen/starch synthase, partial [Methanosarcina sp. UBA5]|uniref:glycogen/starch synthase n=1 Tax=Methanosarcina sp. UBA5 TaxID=1915593 RepID=UPI0025F66C33